MGIWGNRFYENDDTCDVRDSYLSLLETSDTDEEAYFRLLERMKDRMENDEDALVFWAALADTQWRIGRLREDVKDEAVSRIRRSLEEPIVRQDDISALLRDELQSICEKLFQPMPKKKRIQKLLVGKQDLWDLNDIYAYQFHSKESVKAGCWGKYIAVQKIGSGPLFVEREVVAMRVHFFDKLYDTIPTVSEVKETRILPLDLPQRCNISHDARNPYNPERLIPKRPIEMNTLIAAWRTSAYPKKYLFYVGNMDIVPNRNNKSDVSSLDWDNIEDSLLFYLRLWKNLEYIDMGNGVFDFQGGNV